MATYVCKELNLNIHDHLNILKLECNSAVAYNVILIPIQKEFAHIADKYLVQKK